MALRTHHSIIDAWSLQVLLADLAAAYHSALAGKQPELPVLEVQYSDFAAWQHKQLESGGWQEHVDFWKTQLAGANEVLDLPAAHPRPEDSSGEGYFVPVTITSALRQKLEAVATEARASPLMLLTAVFQVQFRLTITKFPFVSFWRLSDAISCGNSCKALLQKDIDDS